MKDKIIDLDSYWKEYNNHLQYDPFKMGKPRKVSIKAGPLKVVKVERPTSGFTNAILNSAIAADPAIAAASGYEYGKVPTQGQPNEQLTNNISEIAGMVNPLQIAVDFIPGREPNIATNLEQTAFSNMINPPQRARQGLSFGQKLLYYLPRLLK